MPSPLPVTQVTDRDMENGYAQVPGSISSHPSLDASTAEATARTSPQQEDSQTDRTEKAAKDHDPFLGSISTPTSHRNQASQDSLWRAFLRAFGLGIVLTIVRKLRGRTPTEEKKVVAYQRRSYAMIGCLIHFLPILTALFLIIFNSMQFFIRTLAGTEGQDYEKLEGLQFAAKVHELLIAASLGSIVFTAIRMELLFGDGLAYGAIFAALAINNVSTLWSREFWSVVRDGRARRRSRQPTYWLAALIFLCTLLVTLGAPSSAILMRPRLEYWPTGGTTFWLNATRAQLEPSYLEYTPEMATCHEDYSRLNCPSGGYKTLAESWFSFWPALRPLGDMPIDIGMRGKSSVRRMSLQPTKYGHDGSLVRGTSYSAATAPPVALADALAAFEPLWAFAARQVLTVNRRWAWRMGLRISAPILQPIVMARCEVARLDDARVWFPDLDSMTLPATYSNPYPDYEMFTLDPGTALASDIAGFASSANTTRRPGVMWLGNGTFPDHRGSLYAAVSVPTDDPNMRESFGCAIDAKLAPVNVVATGPTVQSEAWFEWNHYGTHNSTWPRIAMTAAWADLTTGIPPFMRNSANGNEALLPFEELAKAAGLWNSSMTNPDLVRNIVGLEMILAALIANGISRSTYNVETAGSLRGLVDPDSKWSGGGWMNELLPPLHKQMGWGGNAFEITDQERQTATQYTSRIQAQGYGYSPDGSPMKAAMAVMGCYVLLALLHIGYVFFSSNSAGCWDTSPELVALAMGSARTSAMENTGGGIRATSTLGTTVKVRVRNSRLELVALTDEDQGKPVLRDVAYT